MKSLLHTRSRYYSGFTFIELLVGVTIFTVVLASLFAVLVSLLNADRFRDRYAVVTQAARFAYEPIVRSLKSANADESLLADDGSCVTVRGFYVVNGNGRLVRNYKLSAFTPIPALENGHRLVAITAEDYQDDTNGPMKRWIKREYQLAENDPDPDDPTRTPNNTIIETTYEAGIPRFEWPNKMVSDTCEQYLAHWKRTSTPPRKLTSAKSNIHRISVRMATPTLKPGADRSPFVTLEISASHGKYTGDSPSYRDPVNFTSKTYVPPLTLRSTITPTFSYGVIHD